MDYGFILSEELVIRQEFYDAVILLDQIIRMEREHNYFKLFFEEVQIFMEHIVLNKLEGSINDEMALDAWERTLELGLGKKFDSAVLMKMSQAYSRMGDMETAAMCVKAASRL